MAKAATPPPPPGGTPPAPAAAPAAAPAPAPAPAAQPEAAAAAPAAQPEAPAGAAPAPAGGVARVRALKYHLHDPTSGVLIPAGGSIEAPVTPWLEMQIEAKMIERVAAPAAPAVAE